MIDFSISSMNQSQEAMTASSMVSSFPRDMSWDDLNNQPHADMDNNVMMLSGDRTLFHGGDVEVEVADYYGDSGGFGGDHDGGKRRFLSTERAAVTNRTLDLSRGGSLNRTFRVRGEPRKLSSGGPASASLGSVSCWWTIQIICRL